jgi:hypothetical protein
MAHLMLWYCGGCGGVVVWRCGDVVEWWCGGVVVVVWVWWCGDVVGGGGVAKCCGGSAVGCVVVMWCGGGVEWWCGCVGVVVWCTVFRLCPGRSLLKL